MDINATLGDMLNAIKGITAGTWPQVKTMAGNFIESRRERFQLLADFRLSDQITDEDLRSRLEDEKKVLENEMLALKIVSEVMAQNAANAAIDVLQKAIAAAAKLA